MNPDTVTSICRLGALEQAGAICRGELSSREVIEAHLARIEEVNPRVNALHAVLTDAALAEADTADRRLAGGEEVGPLHGVPVSIKENIDVAGTATTCGVAALAEKVSSTDAPLVTNLRAAGAIPISRGNMPDFAMRWHTSSDVMGATLNPWDAARTPGGSSGGEAVALATGMAPLGVGNDIGGSLRFPSQCVGTAALRPSHGRIPDTTAIIPDDGPPSFQLFNSQGPMARRMEDVRAAFAAMIAPNPTDPWHIPAPLYLGPPAEPIEVSLAIPDDTDPGIDAGVRRAAAVLEAAGYRVQEAMPPQLDRAAELYIEILHEDVRVVWPEWEALASETARRSTNVDLVATEPLDLTGYALRWQERRTLARAWSLFQAQAPLILAPIYTQPPFGPDDDIDDSRPGVGIYYGMRLVVAVNLFSLPSAAVPVGLDHDGMPLGVQIIGPRFREDMCLDAAAAIEAELGTVTPIEPRV